MNFAVIMKPLFVLLILLLFVIRLLLVAFYQQRSGDYFSNKMFLQYSKLEIISTSNIVRKKVMVAANWLNTFLWGLLVMLAFLFL